MRWASSISTHVSIEGCIEEAVAAVTKQLAGHDPDLTLIFVSPQFRQQYRIIPQLLRDKMPVGTLLGCSGGGIIGAGREVEHHPAFSITAAHLPGVAIQPIHSETVDLPDPETAPSVWREWLGVAGEKEPQFVVLADPFSFHGEEFLAGMDFAYPNASVVGGLASGANSSGGNALYLDDKIYNMGMVGVALSGNIQMDTIVAQGCRPIGKPMSITKCDQTLLQELDGKPPLEILEEMVDSLTEYDRKLLRTSLFLGIEMDPLKEDPGQGDFLIRNLMGVDRETGSVSIGALLREGQLVQFHLRDRVMSAEDLKVMLSRYQSKGGWREAKGALLFSCLGRGEYLYGAPNHDSDVFKTKIGNIPLGGFFCNGEIGPVGRATFLHGYTSSFGIFRPSETSGNT
ncbi:MAG: hypothetical protein GWM98_26095 [Nitrospinaceae bacterium]|nr:hypothetical protein [Nitrospinaceae bacterium]NIR57305.1 hypothetical protein [Nitrospinaceae bacterium]NIS87757.1 hypothetical protein [Nitrospinaceae bacterium]NIT84627.1 hypothetical protein [Nitrospinaceae bacterium]NIU46806.1 hypothetical protein [Nitrospinaceae bacterium]